MADSDKSPDKSPRLQQPPPGHTLKSLHLLEFLCPPPRGLNLTTFPFQLVRRLQLTANRRAFFH